MSSQVSSTPKYLTQSIALEESNMPNVMRTGVNIIGSLLVLFFCWATFADVQEVAVAQGEIVPSGHIQTIQHLEGGIVREIMVEDGQLVEKGQPLLKLDDTNANADLGQMKARQTALQFQASRLKMFAEDSSGTKPLSADEQAILTSMQEARAGQESVINDQIQQKQKELQGILDTRKSLERNLTLANEELKINRTLAEKGSVSRMAVMTSERQVNELQGTLATSISQQNQIEAGLNESKSRLSSLGADLKQDAMKNLGTVQAELDEINKSIAKLESASDRTTVEAPMRGVIKGLSVHTIGSVVEQGKTLMEIVPVDEEMVVEALVSPSDIGNLKTGQNVNVKVTAFDFSRFGAVPGKLQSISASTFQKENGQSFYKARIKLDRNYVGHEAGKNIILPGMVVSADIITGEKNYPRISAKTNPQRD